MNLRPVAVEDLDRLFAIQNDPEAHARLGFTRHAPDDRAAYMAHWHKVLPDPQVQARAVVVDGRILGSVACFPRGGRLEVGGWFDRDHAGRGLATAALAALCAELGARPLHALCRFTHGASRRVLAKAGFQDLGPAPEAADHLLFRLDGPGAFRTRLVRYPGKGGWTFAPVPPDHAPPASSPWGRTPVLATFDGRSWQTSVWKDRRHGCVLAVPERLRGARMAGDEAWVALAPRPA